MFYIANAYIYKRGYKAQHKIVHKVINDALIVLAKDKLEQKFLEEKAFAQNILDSFEYERAKRSSFQYELTKEIEKEKANTSLKRAKVFVKAFRELLE